jgi:polyhydroxyalkanoate synthase
MRKGFYPLSVHMGLVVSEMARLREDGGMEDMLRGMQKYHLYKRDIARPDLIEVWRRGAVSLQCMPACVSGLPVLLIPSMINRSGVFNLMEGRSMMQYFAKSGLRPFLLDWGEARYDAAQDDLVSIIAQCIIPASMFIEDICKTRPHAAGYCMGGTLLVAAATQYEFASCIFLATPWDFHAGTAALKQRVEFWAPSAFQGIEAQGFLSQDWAQMVFATLHPLQTRDKFARFAAMDDESEEASVFVAVEDWLNDGVDLPAALARACIEDWYFANKPARGEWVDVSAVACPSLVLASKKDRLVDYESSMALYDALNDAVLVEPDCGHIGMVAGRNAVAEVWQPIAAFIASCNSDSA